MTTEPEELEPEELEDVEEEGESLRQLIREEIRFVLRTNSGETSTSTTQKQTGDDDEPLTLRALEKSVREIVEDAMVPLRMAQQKPKPKPKTKATETEPEPAPIKVTRSKLTSFLWGDE